jgi:hypothetical protein
LLPKLSRRFQKVFQTDGHKKARIMRASEILQRLMTAMRDYSARQGEVRHQLRTAII